MKYMTAQELGISEKEREGLLWFMGRVDRGEIQSITGRDISIGYEGDCFYYGQGHILSECGTVACIGGWVAKYMNVDPLYIDQYMQSGPLHKLYWGLYDVDEKLFPPGKQRSDYVHAPLASHATHKFLMTGTVDWAELVQSEY